MEKKQMELLEDYICSFLKSGNFPVSISFFVYIKRLNLLAASIILVVQHCGQFLFVERLCKHTSCYHETKKKR